MENTMGSTPLEVARNDSTSDKHYDYEEPVFWIEIKKSMTPLVIYCIIVLLGIVGNGLVIYILGFYLKKTVNTIWFLNLTMSNFIFTCFLLLKIVLSAMDNWPSYMVVCKLKTYTSYLNLYATSYFLTAISVEHWISVKTTMWAHNPRRNCLAWLVAGGIWLMALALVLLKMHFGHLIGGLLMCYINYRKTVTKASITHNIILIIETFFAFIIPIGVTIDCHVKTDLRKGIQRKGIKWGKSFRVTTIVIVVFYLCWLPYHVFSFFNTQLIYMPVVFNIVMSITAIVAYSSSCINPIIYIVMGYEFKKRPRPPIFSAFENVFGEDSGMPKIQDQSAN